MNIGQAASASGVSAKMIRYYEQIGLIRPALRTQGNYRNFGPREIGELSFVRCARRIGFSVEEIATLLELWRDRGRAADQIKAEAEGRANELEKRLADLQAIVAALQDLARRCSDGGRPDHPDLVNIAANEPAP